MDLAMSQRYKSAAAALSPIKSPPVSLLGSSLHPSSHTSFPIIAVAVIGILATAFLLVSYYIFVIKCCLSWHRVDLLRRFSFSRRSRPVEDPLMPAHSTTADNRGLTEAAIRSIPIFKFKKSTKSRDCAVCLNEFQDEERLRAIPNCGHVFHIDCIDIWLQNNANCPLCRTSISAAWPDIRFPMDPSIDDSFTGRDEDYVVIEIGSEESDASSVAVTNPSLPRLHAQTSSNELLTNTNSPSLQKILRKKAKKFSHLSSMGDECIDNRRKDERFEVQQIRRSFSMDSADDSQLHLAVQDIIQRHGHVNNVINQSEDCRVIKKSFFSFGQGRGSRSAVQPVALEPRG